MSERLLVVVAHPDDEVIMCGGTIAKFASYGREVRVLVIADGVTSRGAGIDAVMERVAMGSKASDVLGSNGQILGWGDQRIDTVPALDLNKVIEVVVDEFKPHTVITHWQGDVNLDHRLVSAACRVACRPKSGVRVLLEGEIPPAPGFAPNYFVDLTEEFMWRKLQARHCYAEELDGSVHTADGMSIVAGHRGMAIGVKVAEAFEMVRGQE